MDVNKLVCSLATNRLKNVPSSAKSNFQKSILYYQGFTKNYVYSSGKLKEENI